MRMGMRMCVIIQSFMFILYIFISFISFHFVCLSLLCAVKFERTILELPRFQAIWPAVMVKPVSMIRTAPDFPSTAGIVIYAVSVRCEWWALADGAAAVEVSVDLRPGIRLGIFRQMTRVSSSVHPEEMPR